ncbi:hypothetical protein, partial [Microcoleus sp. C2D2]|uniref:hypothetical protein n=1 Tax=Microcoleus sp. C2D2 TaxID=3055326 RepID=UPI002FCF8493
PVQKGRAGRPSHFPCGSYLILIPNRGLKSDAANLFGVTIAVFFVFFPNILENMPNQANNTNPKS